MGLSDLVNNKKRLKYLLFIVVATAFLLRFIAGMSLYSGNFTLLGSGYKGGFWDWGYFEYAKLAINLAEGKGLYYIDEIEGEVWSKRPPLYPMMLAGLYIIFGKDSVPPVIVQSIIGALTVLFTYLIARQAFSKEVGIIASLMAAIYPYYVIHDISLQDTTLFTLLTAVTIYLLLKSSETKTLYNAFLAGVSLALTALTRATILAFLLFVLIWFIIILKDNRMKMISAMLSGFIIISAPWLIRNTMIQGKPVFAVQSGYVLWAGQNPYTLTGYPYENVDKMTAKAWAEISDEQRKYIWGLNELDRNRFFRQKAIEFMKENPSLVLKGAILKIYAAFGWRILPDSGNKIKNIGYTATYLPILLLGAIGAFLARDKWRKLSVIYGLFFIFAATASIFVAHTSHRIYLDIYLMMLSSYTVIQANDYLKKGFKR